MQLFPQITFALENVHYNQPQTLILGSNKPIYGPNKSNFGQNMIISGRIRFFIEDIKFILSSITGAFIVAIQVKQISRHLLFLFGVKKIPILGKKHPLGKLSNLKSGEILDQLNCVNSFQKVPTTLGGGGGHFHFGPSPNFYCFLVWKSSLSVPIQLTPLL